MQFDPEEKALAPGESAPASVALSGIVGVTQGGAGSLVEPAPDLDTFPTRGPLTLARIPSGPEPIVRVAQYALEVMRGK